MSKYKACDVTVAMKTDSDMELRLNSTRINTGFHIYNLLVMIMNSKCVFLRKGTELSNINYL